MARAPPQKIVNFGAKGALRKILGSVGQKWISEKVSKGGPFGSAGGRIPERGRPPNRHHPPLNPPLVSSMILFVSFQTKEVAQKDINPPGCLLCSFLTSKRRSFEKIVWNETNFFSNCRLGSRTELEPDLNYIL